MKLTELIFAEKNITEYSKPCFYVGELSEKIELIKLKQTYSKPFFSYFNSFSFYYGNVFTFGAHKARCAKECKMEVITFSFPMVTKKTHGFP